MLDIDELSKGKELTWSREWFEQLGERPDNPATCMVFVYGYMLFLGAVSESLERLANERIVP